MLIGKLALESGFSRDTIRYYEQRGLLQAEASVRQKNGYTNYHPEALEQLIQIKRLKELGFTLGEIRELFGSLGNVQQPCADLPKTLDIKIAQLEAKLASIQRSRDRLLSVRGACGGECHSEVGLPECFKPPCR